jgi:hypothetical protein
MKLPDKTQDGLSGTAAPKLVQLVSSHSASDNSTHEKEFDTVYFLQAI